MSFSPDGLTLAITVSSAAGSRIYLYDTGRPGVAARLLGPTPGPGSGAATGWSGATYEGTTGRIGVIAGPTCSASGAACAGGSAILTVNPADGTTTTLVDLRRLGLSAASIAFDSSGRQLLFITSGGDLYRWVGGADPTRIASGVTAATWLPAGPPTGSTGSTTSTTVSPAWPSRSMPLNGVPEDLVAGSDAVYGLVSTNPQAPVGEAPTSVFRYEPANDSVAYGSDLPGLSEVALSGNSVWAVAPPARMPGAAVLYRLDPTSLKVKAKIALVVTATMFPQGGAALAAGPDGPVWVGAGEQLFAIDANSGSIISSLETGEQIVSLSVEPSGALLYTASQSSSAALVVTERNAHTGAAQARNANLPAIAGGTVSATSKGVWVSYRTGMLGTAELLASSGLTATFPPAGNSLDQGSPWQVMMGITAMVRSGVVWASASGAVPPYLLCADPDTGAVQAIDHALVSDVTVLGSNLYATAGRNELLLVTPPAQCGGPQDK
jgi:hypothetical protein